MTQDQIVQRLSGLEKAASYLLRTLQTDDHEVYEHRLELYGYYELLQEIRLLVCILEKFENLLTDTDNTDTMQQ